MYTLTSIAYLLMLNRNLDEDIPIFPDSDMKGKQLFSGISFIGLIL